MESSTNRKLLFQTIACYLAAILIWTLLFRKNPILKNVLTDIHTIFSSTLLSYLVIRLLFSSSLIEILKVLIKTIFRVWLLIFITFAISRSTERVGTLLSLTFIFGYTESLFEINKWLENNNPFGYFPKNVSLNKFNHAMATIQLMTIIHMVCAIVVLIFYFFY